MTRPIPRRRRGKSQDPGITEEHGHRDVDAENQEHHDGQRKVKNMPIPKQSLEGLNEGDLGTESSFFQSQCPHLLLKSWRRTGPSKQRSNLLLPSLFV